MILETREVKEYHKNGQLMYETTFGVVSPSFVNAYKNFYFAYKNMIVNDKGETLIRIGFTKRYWDNGQLNWRIKYNDDGSISKEKFPSYRKDGSFIIN